MRRVAVLVLCAACAGGSDEDLLKNGPSVGTACSGGGTAMLADVPVGVPSQYTRAFADLRGSRTAIWLMPQGNLSVTECELSFNGTEMPWRPTIEAQQLGTFTVESDAVSIFSPPAQTLAAGSVTLAGYDDAARSLCGSIDLTTTSGGRLRGTFSAQVFCE